jgi:hypothetical protein
MLIPAVAAVAALVFLVLWLITLTKLHEATSNSVPPPVLIPHIMHVCACSKRYLTAQEVDACYLSHKE